MVVGTADFSNETLTLYESQGFHRIRVIENYFIENYPFPVMDKNQHCKDMVILERNLKQT
jgi:ribosomal protein S18 acetylase RimI-like enzyme